MRLLIGGMRGSQPATGAGFAEFGGDTTSLLVLGSRGTRLVLDAGTGLGRVAEALATTGAGEVTVLFSHYHLDHLAGLTMCPLFYDSRWSFRFVGPTFADGGVEAVVQGLLRPPYWPMRCQDMGARFEFAEFAIGGAGAGEAGTGDFWRPDLEIGELSVRGCRVPHPGGCLAYRVEDRGGGSLVFATDLEWGRRSSRDEQALLTLCRTPRPADLLLMDAHVDDAQAERFAGWGHSSRENCLQVAAAAGVAAVLLGHHSPTADDASLRAVERAVQRRHPTATLARGGQWLTVGGGG